MTHYATVSPLGLFVTKGLPSQIKVCSRCSGPVSKLAPWLRQRALKGAWHDGSGRVFWVESALCTVLGWCFAGRGVVILVG